jgi:hypothetical protein
VIDKLEYATWALGHDQTILAKMPAKSISGLGPLSDREIARRNTTALACAVTLLTATNRIVGRCAASQIASASAAPFSAA